MRHILLLALLTLPAAASAQTARPPVSNPTAGPSSTPAPVPSIPPGTPQTGATTMPPERIAPSAGGGTADPTDTSLPNASPLSGSPPSLNPGTNQVAPRGGGAGPQTPNLSR